MYTHGDLEINELYSISFLWILGLNQTKRYVI